MGSDNAGADGIEPVKNVVRIERRYILFSGGPFAAELCFRGLLIFRADACSSQEGKDLECCSSSKVSGESP